jgi:8-oxo-dGTP diphosphatase
MIQDGSIKAPPEAPFYFRCGWYTFGMENRPKVGIGIMIFKDGKILLGKRKASHGAGEYAFPGGHLEYMEGFEQCARREIAEESGIKVKNVQFQFLANVKEYNPKHYVHIGLIADWESGEPQTLEPEKLESWGWYSLDNLPQPMFKASVRTIEAFKRNQMYQDSE